MKNLGYMFSFLLIAIFMPVAIWVAAGVAMVQNRRPRRHAEEPVLQV
jgi:hypothetical protein